ncbi:amidase family protein [Anaerorhabdus furcosa]|uniref:Glutamyl-tRNA(Gln) amidotransferase subunit A n=1 Tax=Anaerorhabdus furcosa TaxID=118967 RepID=A0A1T4JUI0_9FIRM|nr:amidase family protein [Anaerorhabdus furcosa]SJZ33826.1 aspartyl-tRNA(Asn)/glutamyl-tRNA(Gln) amidotransferase subunit A [Anaerorhabdus furcosa]
MIEKLRNDVAHAKENVQQAIDLAHKIQPKINAVVTFVDPSEQLAHLDEVKNGLMAGVPIALKDNVNTKGIRTTASSKILDNYVPVYNAHIVDLLKKQGAIYIAKASMDELAMGGSNLTAYTGPVANPWDTTRMSGGSSGGSAALVASGVVPFAIGSDTGDSVRKPAAFCGVVGVKPTYGRISRYGIIPYASSLDHVGYFTRNVKDACIGLEVLAGRDDRDMTSSNKEVPAFSSLLNASLKGKKIGIIKNVTDAIKNEATSKAFNELITKMKNEGAEIQEIEFDNALLRAILPTYYMIANCEATANHSNLDGIRFGEQEMGDSTEEVMINSRTKGFGLQVRKRFITGSYGLFVENQEKLFRKAQRVRRLIVEAMQKALQDVDCLIAPASSTIAPKIKGEKIDELMDEYLVAENFMVMGNFSGYPSMTLPMGFDQGCPLGVNITCKAFDEETMFNLGAGIENCTGLHDLVAEVE